MTHENLGSLGNLMFFCVSAKLLNFLNFLNFLKKNSVFHGLWNTLFFSLTRQMPKEPCYTDSTLIL